MVAPSMADALKAFPRESNVFKERFPCLSRYAERVSLQVKVMLRPSAPHSSATRAGAASSSTLWRILFGFVVVVLTSLRARKPGEAPAQGRPTRTDGRARSGP